MTPPRWEMDTGIYDFTLMGDSSRGLCLYQNGYEGSYLWFHGDWGMEKNNCDFTEMEADVYAFTEGTACWCLGLHWVGAEGRICDCAEVWDGGKCLGLHRVRVRRDISCLRKGSYCSVLPQRCKKSIFSLFHVFLIIVNTFHWLYSYREIQKLLPTFPRQITSLKCLSNSLFFFSSLSFSSSFFLFLKSGFLCSFGACPGTHSVDQVVLERFSCLCLPRAMIKCVCHHHPTLFYFNCWKRSARYKSLFHSRVP